MIEFRTVTAPYPGLRPFEPHESEIFFGREGHTDRLLEILQRERFLAVIGPSGCGKSSLVRAGLLPGLASGALGTGSDWRLALLRPGGQPMGALAQALLSPYALGHELVGKDRLPKDVDDVTADVALVAAELRLGPTGLAGLLQTAAARRPEGSAPFNLLILVDQFEELFTYAHASGSVADETEDFVKLLLAARDDAGLCQNSPHPGRLPGGEGDSQTLCRIYVTLTMRTDFLGNCVRFLDLPEAINRAQYLTPRLNEQELTNAIVGPARVFGGDVAKALVPRSIQAISHDSDQLPILQHALALMWREAQRANPAEPLITEACIEAVGGGIDKALNHHADEVWSSLKDPGLQSLAEILFRAITERREAGGQDVRRPQNLKAIAQWADVPADAFKPVIAVYAAPEVSFLHYGRELTNTSVIDLTHEALIRQWDRLKGWVADEYRRGQGYRRWSERAAEHAAGQAGLLVGGDLARALEWWNPGLKDEKWQPEPAWAGRYSSEEDTALAAELELTRGFLMDSRDAEQQEREREQKRLQQEAEAERQRAQMQSRLAEEARSSEGRARRMTKFVALVAFCAIGLFIATLFFKLQAQTAEKQRTASLFESQLTHGNLLARVENYAEGRRVLAESTRLDPDIPEARRHDRNLSAGFAEMMGSQAEQVYTGAGAALTGGVAVSPDGKLLAAAGERGTLVLFDAASGKLLQRLEGHDPKAGDQGTVYSVVFGPQGRWLFSSGDDGRIIRWSLPEGKKLGEWKVPDRVHALAISPDGQTLASGGRDSKITLWSTADGKKLGGLEGHTNSIAQIGLAFSPDGNRLGSGSYDKTARLWDWRKGKSLLTLKGHTDSVHAVAFSPDGRLLATASGDKQVILWDIDPAQPATLGHTIRVLRGHQNMVFDLAYTADGRQLLSASRDNTLRQWDVESGITRRVYQGHEAALTSVALRGDNIFTAANDATVRRWSLATPQQWVWKTGGSPEAAAVSPTGKWVAVGMKDGGLRLYGLPDGKLLAEQPNAHHGSGGVNRIALNRDGNLLATAGMDEKAKLWRVEAEGNTLTPLQTLDGHKGAVFGVAFSPGGNRLATAGDDGQIGLFEVANGQGRLFPAHEGGVTSVAFSPDGKRLLSTGREDRRLRLWHLDDPSRPHQDIAQARDGLSWAIISPDGGAIAAVGREQTVSLYRLNQPGAPSRLVGHEETVFRAIYSPDGHQLATVSADMTVRLWDLDSLRLLITLRLPTEMQYPSPLWDFDFRCTADGDCWIAVPLTVGRVAVYRLPYDHPPASQ